MEFGSSSSLESKETKPTLCCIVSMWERKSRVLLYIPINAPVLLESHCDSVRRRYDHEARNDDCLQYIFEVEHCQRLLCVTCWCVCGCEQSVHRIRSVLHIDYAIHLLLMWATCKCVLRWRYAVIRVSESYRMDMSRGWGVAYWCLSAQCVSERCCSLLNRRQGVPCWTRADVS